MFFIFSGSFIGQLFLFSQATIAKKAKRILIWILKKEPSADILNGAKKITNITLHLESMRKNNNYMKIFEGDNMEILNEYLSPSSQLLLNDFYDRHKNDIIMCQKCGQACDPNNLAWRCDSCLDRYHYKCSSAQTIAENSTDYYLCTKCRFSHGF